MKKIISIILFIATIIAIPEFYIHIKEYMVSNGGTIKMLMMNNQVSNNDERTIFVCVSDENQSMKGISVTPIYDNSSEYPVNGFDLRYSVEIADGGVPNSNSLFEKVQMSDNVYQFKYKENSLPQFSQTYEPFHLSDLPIINSRYVIKAKASYSGSSQPYIYTVRLWILVVPKRTNQSFEDWKMSCKNNIYLTDPSSENNDVYYCCDNQLYSEFGKDFGVIASKNRRTDIDVPKEEKKDQIVEEETKKIEVTDSLPVSISGEMKFLGFSQYTQDSISLLSIKANQVIRVDSTCYVVYHLDTEDEFLWNYVSVNSFLGKYILRNRNNYYYAQKLIGNGTELATIKPLETGKIDYVTSVNNVQNNNVVLDKQDGRCVLINNSDNPVIVVYGVDNSSTSVCALCVGGKYVIPQTDDEAIKVLKTFSFDEKEEESRPWWDYAWRYLFFAFFFLSAGFWVFLYFIGALDKKERLEDISYFMFAFLASIYVFFAVL